MADDTDNEKRHGKSMMRMDLEGRTAFGRPRPLVEPRPYRTDERGRPVAMKVDSAPPRPTGRKPFPLEEPKPE